MLLCNARNNSQGFTLIELIIIVFIVGILSAIAAPSFLALLNKSKVNNAVAQVQGALQEAQVQAIRKSKQCSVTLTTTAVTGDCLVTGDRTLPEGVLMKTNIDVNPDVTGNPIQIKFGMRGNTEFPVVTGTKCTTDCSTTGKILLYQSDDPISNIKCVAISNGIGILRSGNYKVSLTTPANITDEICEQPPQ